MFSVIDVDVPFEGNEDVVVSVVFISPLTSLVVVEEVIDVETIGLLSNCPCDIMVSFSLFRVLTLPIDISGTKEFEGFLKIIKTVLWKIFNIFVLIYNPSTKNLI